MTASHNVGSFLERMSTFLLLMPRFQHTIASFINASMSLIFYTTSNDQQQVRSLLSANKPQEIEIPFDVAEAPANKLSAVKAV